MQEGEVKEVRFGDVEIRLRASQEDVALARKLLDIFEDQFARVAKRTGRLTKRQAAQMDAKIIEFLKHGDRRKKELRSELGISGAKLNGRLGLLIGKGSVVRRGRALYGLAETGT